MVLLEGGRVIVIGAAVGVAAAFWLTSVLESMLVDVTAFDTATFIGALSVLSIVSFAAVLIPALRATKLDPLLALQSE
jgi:ABC-type antimicrobial peptide transport system permease subunit